MFFYIKDNSFLLIIIDGDTKGDYYKIAIFNWDIKNNTVNKIDEININGNNIKMPQVLISKDNKNIWLITWTGIRHEGRCPKDIWEETLKWNIYVYNIDKRTSELVEISPDIFNNIKDEIKL